MFVAGCGGGGNPPPPGTPSAAENLVNVAEVRKQPGGSPQQAFLQWWMSIQYNDLGGYLNGLSASLRNQREHDGSARRDVPLVSGDLIDSRPKIVNVQNANGVGTIFTRIETRQPVGATRFTTSSYPQAFTLVREGGQWKIADDLFIQNRVAAVRQALNKAR